MLESDTKLLILDLDETLAYATLTPLQREPDFLAGPYSVYKRPHVDEFIRACLEWFRVAVWSSSSPLYCEAIVANLFSSPGELAFVWASDRCTYAYDLECGERYWRKNIRKVKRLGYRLESIVAVDDTLKKWEKSYGNVVIVRPYLGNEEDDELPLLMHYLDSLRNTANIRRIDKLRWRSRVSEQLSGIQNPS